LNTGEFRDCLLAIHARSDDRRFLHANVGARILKPRTLLLDALRKSLRIYHSKHITRLHQRIEICIDLDNFSRDFRANLHGRCRLHAARSIDDARNLAALDGRSDQLRFSGRLVGLAAAGWQKQSSRQGAKRGAV